MSVITTCSGCISVTLCELYLQDRWRHDTSPAFSFDSVVRVAWFLATGKLLVKTLHILWRNTQIGRARPRYKGTRAGDFFCLQIGWTPMFFKETRNWTLLSVVSHCWLHYKVQRLRLMILLHFFLLQFKERHVAWILSKVLRLLGCTRKTPGEDFDTFLFIAI